MERPDRLSVMADIAAVFHWPPSELRELEIDDLLTFRELARVRSGHK